MTKKKSAIGFFVIGSFELHSPFVIRASSFDRSSVLICGLNEIRQAQVRIAGLSCLARPLLQDNVLKVSPVREQINPVQCEQSDD